jgi:hypothetical protein
MDNSLRARSNGSVAPASAIKTIVLQLALNPGAALAPGGRAQGYVITAPLDDAGYFDTDGLTPRRWPVRRFGDAGDGETGWLAHRGRAWFIDYDDSIPNDDEAIFRLSDHRFVVGEYITITNAVGKPMTYRVAEVEPLTDRAAIQSFIQKVSKT